MEANGTQFINVLREHPFLLSMRPEHLKVIAETAKAGEFETGDMLFHQGEPANQFFLIRSGRITLEAVDASHGGTVARVETLGEGDVLGWSWLVPPFSWNLQARAIEPTKVIVIDGAHLLTTCETDPEFGYALMKRVAQLMAHRFQALRKQFVEECEGHWKGELLHD